MNNRSLVHFFNKSIFATNSWTLHSCFEWRGWILFLLPNAKLTLRRITHCRVNWKFKLFKPKTNNTICFVLFCFVQRRRRRRWWWKISWWTWWRSWWISWWAWSWRRRRLSRSWSWSKFTSTSSKQFQVLLSFVLHFLFDFQIHFSFKFFLFVSMWGQLLLSCFWFWKTPKWFHLSVIEFLLYKRRANSLFPNCSAMSTHWTQLRFLHFLLCLFSLSKRYTLLSIGGSLLWERGECSNDFEGVPLSFLIISIFLLFSSLSLSGLLLCSCFCIFCAFTETPFTWWKWFPSSLWCWNSTSCVSLSLSLHLTKTHAQASDFESEVHSSFIITLTLKQREKSVQSDNMHKREREADTTDTQPMGFSSVCYVVCDVIFPLLVLLNRTSHSSLVDYWFSEISDLRFALLLLFLLFLLHLPFSRSPSPNNDRSPRND